MTTPDPTQEITQVAIDLLNLSTAAIEFVTNDILPYVPDGLEVAGLILETIVEPLVEGFNTAVCG
jgi:hypothetical protein